MMIIKMLIVPCLELSKCENFHTWPSLLLHVVFIQNFTKIRLDWSEQCSPTQYRLYRRRFLQVKRPKQQYQNTEGTNSTQKSNIQ